MKKASLTLLSLCGILVVFSSCDRTDWACNCYSKVHDTLTNHQYWDYGRTQASHADDMCRSHLGVSADTCYTIGYK